MLKRAAFRLTDRVLRVVVVLSLWQAPVPWFHSHTMDLGDRLADVEFVRHLARFHSPESLREAGHVAHHRSAWHLHFVFLWEMHDGDEGGNDERPELPISSVALPGNTLVISAPSPVGQLFEACCPNGLVAAGHCGLEAAFIQPRHFLGTYLATRSTCALLCVSRC